MHTLRIKMLKLQIFFCIKNRLLTFVAKKLANPEQVCIACVFIEPIPCVPYDIFTGRQFSLTFHLLALWCHAYENMP